jgi:hypothetical protein
VQGNYYGSHSKPEPQAINQISYFGLVETKLEFIFFSAVWWEHQLDCTATEKEQAQPRGCPRTKKKARTTPRVVIVASQETIAGRPRGDLT